MRDLRYSKNIYNSILNVQIQFLIVEWLKEDFIAYLNEWENGVKTLPLSKKEQQRQCLSRETLEGMKITSKIMSVIHVAIIIISSLL